MNLSENETRILADLLQHAEDYFLRNRPKVHFIMQQTPENAQLIRECEVYCNPHTPEAIEDPSIFLIEDKYCYKDFVLASYFADKLKNSLPVPETLEETVTTEIN
ncbi:hypothetical protein FD723_40695 (plasmid) [Nostoc sp. C052]|uniref:hypothetical protein n=1 Tax=Nostoc sp. C052 TaxID=2576902 RepID=UPI0015C32B32|nr:hypothetical protein [Nostoc sp. C052]QLE46534.1 hypothetical protein FD723_40695 [Nostoc sp. C052]